MASRPRPEAAEHRRDAASRLARRRLRRRRLGPGALRRPGRAARHWSRSGAFVAAATPEFAENGLAEALFVIASEYERPTRAWLERRGFQATFVHSYGATEVFPPEDADCIVDNMATGETLQANGLVVVDELMRSSTRLYAHPRALDAPEKRAHRDADPAAALGAGRAPAGDARQQRRRRSPGGGDRGAASMREPTMAPLHGDQGFALKAAVPRADLPRVIPEIKARRHRHRGHRARPDRALSVPWRAGRPG